MKRSTDLRRLKTSAAAEAAKNLAKLIAPALSQRCVSIRQFSAALRSAAVEFEASKYAGVKVNKARIAFSLGLTRGEVAKQLRADIAAVSNDIESVIATWCSDDRFKNPEHQPADLPIFGKSGSFEQIAKIHGKGLPVRAMLDEFLDRGIAVRLPAQKIRLRRRTLALEQRSWTKIKNQLAVLSDDPEHKNAGRDAGQACGGTRSRTNLKRQPSRA